MQYAIDAIRGATQDLEDDRIARQLNALYIADDLILEANAKQCLHLINKLIDRVSELTGIAPELEDAAFKLAEHIKSDGNNE